MSMCLSYKTIISNERNQVTERCSVDYMQNNRKKYHKKGWRVKGGRKVQEGGDIRVHACMHAKLLQLCLTLGNFVDCSPPGSSIHGILQVRVLE